jgi:uncharacterized protein
MFAADWLDVAFVHFRVDPNLLQPCVPFELDLLNGDAYVSIVSFTQRRLRPMIGGRFAELLATPLAQHEFLNLRTYVRHEGACGIYFLAEWIPNRLAQLIGPRLYGLPYRLGRLDYARDRRLIRSRGRRLDFTITTRATCEHDRLSDFLVERYSAFTHFDDLSRRFDIAHRPWQLSPCDVSIARADLLTNAAPCLIDVAPICAYHSIGVRDVVISRPMRVITSPATRVRRSRCRPRRIGSAGCP